ncbi:MAG TPA: sulfur carrier protein ThiS [Polyangium sp.]|nr:sulfur carrier protein ThiS [Polyangium sp.]
MIRVNGKTVENCPVNLVELLAAQGFSGETKGIAVAINGTVVPRSTWAETRLADGDEIELVKIMQGG